MSMNRYTAYKNSGVEWIGEIPEHWEAKRLKHSSLVTPSNVDKHIYADEIQVKLCNYTDVYYNEFITKSTILKPGSCNNSEFEKFQLEGGDVIITKDSETPNDIGVPALVKDNLENVVCGYHLTMIKPIDGIGEYIFRFIQSDRTRSYFEIHANGVTRFGLGKASIENLVVPYPPLPEQRAIAQYLDTKTAQIDRLIQLKERKIELLREKRTALINHVVTKGLDPDVKMKDSGVEWIGEVPEHWEIARLAALGRFSKGKGITKENIVETGFQAIRCGEIYTSYERILNRSVSHIDECIRCVSVPVTYGALLFAGDGETHEEIGKCVVFTGDDVLYVGGGINILTLINTDSPLFLSYAVNSEYVVFQKARQGKGEIVVHIYAKQLRDLQIALPPSTEQVEIATYLDNQYSEIEELIKMEQKKINLLKEYRQALISEVVTGKIRVCEEDHSVNAETVEHSL